jgi:hypothetical protein
MLRHLFATFAVTCLMTAVLPTSRSDDRSQSDDRLFEMRVYYAAEGKLDALHDRFRHHTVQLFEKHGIQNIGYWTPVENPESKLIYFLAYPDQESRKKSWKSFMGDPEWQAAFKASEADGTLVRKVESAFFNATDYSPAVQPEIVGDRIFEMRTYRATPGNLEALHSRFREHTVELFKKHGMTNIAYWTPIEGQKDWEESFVYLLAHESREAARQSFDGFRRDPAWIAARKASEEKAGGSLTKTPGGVQSEFVIATDYSPIQ